MPSPQKFSRISFPQFSPLVADEVHKITQVLHFQACFLAPIEEKWLVLSDSSAPAHQKHWWFCRYLCSCQVKETFRTTSLMIYKIKYICLGSTWFVHDGYAVSFVTILLVFIQKKGHCFDKIVILLNIWKQWMYIMLGHSITHWDWEIRYQYIHLVTYRVGYRLQWQCPNLVWKLEMGVPMCLCVKKKHKRTIIPF